MEGIRPEGMGDNLKDNKSETLNQFGLPENWSHNRSLQALDHLRKELNKKDLVTTEYISSILDHIFTIADQEYRKYRNLPFGHTNDLKLIPGEYEYLKMEPEEKLQYFKSRWPQGMEVKGTDGFIKWEVILDYEMWAIKNHDQTLATLQRRHGLSPSELGIIILGLNDSEYMATTHEAARKQDERLFDWLKQKGYLQE